MEGLLARATGSGGGGDCGTVAELASQLRALLAEKVSPAKTEHVSANFELRSSAVFEIPITDSNRPGSGDTMIGNAAASPIEGVRATQIVSAGDALMNQPEHDPVLQTAITRSIIGLLAEVDGSHWMVRSVARVAQSWHFVYICAKSCKEWTRQSAKTPAKTVIGAWSNKDGLDPVNAARPAFDCRGSVEIAFSKGSRTISVKYEHSPMHQTVAELMELLVPPPAPIEVPLAQPKEPKPAKAPRTPKTPATGRKKRPADAGDEATPGDGSTRPKKSRKKSNGQTLPVAPVAMMIAPEPEASNPTLAVVDSQLAQYHGDQNGRPTRDSNHQHQEAAALSAPDSEADPTTVGMHLHSIPILSADEVERRRQVALQMLSDAGVDPKTLSADQFGIFANQSPELQQESLAMLVQYGAERLRIVHPAKEASSDSSTPPPSQPGPASTVASAQPSEPGSNTTGTTGESALIGTETTISTATEALEGRKKAGLSCQGCRDSRAKCDKEKPSCMKCRSSGRVCYYPPRKKKAPRKKGEGIPTVQPEPAEAPESPTPGEPEDEEPDDLPSPGFEDNTTISTQQLDSQYPPPPDSSFHYYPGLSAGYQPTESLPHSEPAAPQTSQAPSYAETEVETNSGRYSYAPNQPSARQVPEPTNIPVEKPAASVQAPRQKSASRAKSRSQKGLSLSQPAASAPPTGNGGASGSMSQYQSWAAANPPNTAPSSVQRPADVPGSNKMNSSRSQPYSGQQRPLGVNQESHAASESDIHNSALPSLHANGFQAASALAQMSRPSTGRGDRRTRTMTPVQNQSVPRQTQASVRAAPADSTPSYNNYSVPQHSSTNATTETSGRTISYEQYAKQPASSNTNPYMYYGNTYSNEPNTPALASSSSFPDTMPSGYDSGVGQRAAMWHSTAPSQSRPRDTPAHTHVSRSNTPHAVSPSSNVSTLPHATQARPASKTPDSGYASNFGNSQPQSQQQYRQRAQQPRQQQVQSHVPQAQEHQPTSANQQQHNWYGPSNHANSSSTYSTANSMSTRYNHEVPVGGGSYNQGHRPMNMNGVGGYSEVEGEQTLYGLLGNN